MNESGTRKWILAAAIILLAIFYSQYMHHSVVAIQATPSNIPTVITEESPTLTAIASPSFTVTSTIGKMGVEETINYKCGGKGKIVYASIKLSPFGGIPPYEITVTPVIASKLDLVHSYEVTSGTPFSLSPGVAIVYTIRSGSLDHKPDTSGNITVPLISEEICNSNKSSVKIVVNSPVPTDTLVLNHPTDTPRSNQPIDTPTDTPKPSRPTDTSTPNRPTNTPTPIPPNKSECEDGIDNDGDKSVDLQDADCSGSQDNHEDK